MNAGTLTSIVYQPLDRAYENRTGDFIRVPVESIRLIEDVGIEGDQKARRGSIRQVNILSAEWLARLSARGYRTLPGEMGEQLIVTGFAIEKLAPGDRFRIGGEAILEITKPRTGCSRLEAAQGQAIRGIEPAIGMLARVITGGVIAVGDAVTAGDETRRTA